MLHALTTKAHLTHAASSRAIATNLSPPALVFVQHRRAANTLSAIIRGVRKAVQAEDRPIRSELTRKSRPTTNVTPSAEPRREGWRDKVGTKKEAGRGGTFRGTLRSTDGHPRRNAIGSGRGSGLRAPLPRSRTSGETYHVPISVPHTTAASEFLYGTNTVMAALKANRRRLYKLYIQGEEGDKSLGAVVNTAVKRTKVPLEWVDTSFLPVMSQMSRGRPHNNCILEASPLPKLPVIEMLEFSKEESWFMFRLGSQSKEDREVNGVDNKIKYDNQGWRYPLILMLDSIVDEGNLGAILRTAHYFGVDAVALSTHTCAPLSNISLKAASGAAEAVPLLTIANASQFLERSYYRGWRIFTADAAAPNPSFARTPFWAAAENDDPTDHRSEPVSPDIALHLTPTSNYHRSDGRATIHPVPLREAPCILVLGGEASGVSIPVRKRTEVFVTLTTPGPARDVGVDSLNVSAAASILLWEFLRGAELSGARGKMRRELAERPRDRKEATNRKPISGDEAWLESHNVKQKK